MTSIASRTGLFIFCALAWAQLLLFTSSAIAADSLPVLDIHQLIHQELRNPVEFLIADHDSTLAEVQAAAFTPLRASHINRGVTKETYWLRVRLRNPDPATDKAWVLHHETSYLDNLTIYYSDNGGPPAEVHLSDRRPFSERVVDYSKLAFRHRTPAAGFTDLYLRFGNTAADTTTLNFHLWDAARFEHAVKRQYLTQGAYIGTMLAITVIALVCALALRRLIYLYYAAFLLLSGLLWATMNGLAFQYLWPGAPAWHNNSFHIIFLLMPLAVFQFSKALLRTRQLFPRVHRLLSATQVVMVVGIALRLLGSYELVLWFAYGALALLALLPVLGWYAWRHGLRYARWYMWAWLVYGGTVAMSLLSATGGISGWGMEPLFYAQLGSLIEVVLLTMAMGERLIDWDRERQQALKMAHHDPLTGLGNRRRLAQAFSALRERFNADAQPVFMVMIDLDDFKKINDAHGHDAGDEVLRNVARLLIRRTRAGDVCTRYGGEEFAILLQAPSLRAAHQMVDRIRVEFAGMQTTYRGRTINHTFSAGITEVLSGDLQLNREEMLRQADAALYRAKITGRNQTTLFAESVV